MTSLLTKVQSTIVIIHALRLHTGVSTTGTRALEKGFIAMDDDYKLALIIRNEWRIFTDAVLGRFMWSTRETLRNKLL